MEIPMTEFRSIDARTGQPHGPALAVHGLDDVARLCAAAEAAFDLYRATGREERAAFLERIAEEILAIGDPLIEAAMRESGLPRPAWRVNAAAPWASFACLPPWCAQAPGSSCASIRPCRNANPCPAPTSACA
jgi:acyl-CoA reductase-like NAD-dependent aldehyde dehydrogenase